MKKRSNQEVLPAAPRGYLCDWNHKLETMPASGTFEVLHIETVARFDNDGVMVVHPKTSRLFRPVAWRPR